MNIAALLDQIERCRRLARSINDEEAAARLEEIAREIERRIIDSLLRLVEIGRSSSDDGGHVVDLRCRR